MIKEIRRPLPGRPGRLARFDYEYERNGTCNLFLFVEPQAGWRHVQSTERRTKLDFAHQMKWLVDERYPEAEIIEVILDNLNTHKPASLYEAFEPAEARRILRKINFHYTPKPSLACPVTAARSAYGDDTLMPKYICRQPARARDILGPGKVAGYDLGAENSQRIGALIFAPDERANRQSASAKRLHDHATNPANAAGGACNKNRTRNSHKYRSNLIWRILPQPKTSPLCSHVLTHSITRR